MNVIILKLSFILTFNSSFSNRENESLWREVAELRAKHLQQQQVIRKVKCHSSALCERVRASEPGMLWHTLPYFALSFGFWIFFCM